MQFVSLIFVFKLLAINAIIQMPFDQYPRYPTIIQYLTDLRRNFPDRVNLYSIGRSLEGREILAIRVSCSNCSRTANRPAILLDAGIHGREWMAPLTALYIINELVTNPQNENMKMNVDWYIVPVINPDGYEFTFVGDRYWRKNRRKGVLCDGVDINRNFGFHWNGTEVTCSEVFEGRTQDSEPETKALQKLALHLKGQLKLYITLHTFGPFMIYPWAYTTQTITNLEEHKYLGANVAKAIKKVRGTMYKIGTVGEILYVATGSSLDWLVGVAKVPLSYALELPESTMRFDPPIEERLDISKETFEGMKVFHKYIEDKWRLK